MAITYPLALPGTGKCFKVVTLKMVTSVGVTRSPFTFKQQKQVFNGDYWAMEVTLPRLEEADARDWIGFLASLNGPEGTFLLGDSIRTSPRGSALGTPVVDGAAQTGKTLLTRGWTANQTGVLLAGDYIEISDRLYMVTQDADADVSGDAPLEIFPSIRDLPGDGVTVQLTDPKGLFQLATDEYNLFSVDETKVYSLSFSALEAI